MSPKEQSKLPRNDKGEIILGDVFDAKIWAEEFMRIKSEVNFTIDEGLMLAWFANAIMAGYDYAHREISRQHPQDSRGEIKWPSEAECGLHPHNDSLACCNCADARIKNSTIAACKSAVSSAQALIPLDVDKFVNSLPEAIEIKADEKFPAGWYWEMDDVIDRLREFATKAQPEVPSVEEIITVICENMNWQETENGNFRPLAQAIHTLLTTGRGGKEKE